MRTIGAGVLVAIGAVLALSGQAFAQEPPAQATSVLPVWALVDDDTPIQGGSVRVFGPSGSELAQVDGTQERTEDGGMALLEFASLPPRFTVVVRGGRAGGHGFDGALRLMVDNYNAADAGVVLASPVRTIDAARGVSLREAKALLGIPPWFRDADFVASDRYFDGDRFLKAAKRAGGVDKLVRDLIAKQRKSEHARVRFLSSPRATSPEDDDSWLAAATKAFTGNFKPLLGKVLATAGSAAAQKLGTAALGWTLRYVGLGSLVEDSDKAETKAALKALSESVTQLQSQVTDVQKAVQQSRFDILVGQTNPTLSKIDHATKQLALLAGLKADDESAPGFRDEIVKYIGANLLDKGDYLNRALASNVPLADNLLKAASAVEVARRFFDSQSSNAVNSVAGYYALYEAQLVVLIAEYQHAKPDAYSGDITKATVDDLTNMINAQAASLKPAVPSGAVVDTKTDKMWTQHFKPNPTNANAFFKLVDDGRRLFGYAWPQEAFGPRQIEGLPFDDWALPGKDDFAQLISGRGTLGGVTYLQREARMSPLQNYTEEARGNAFMSKRDGWDLRDAGVNDKSLQIHRFYLGDGRVDDAAPVYFCSRNNDACSQGLREKLAKIKGVVVYVRKLAADESYTWK